MLQLWSKKMLSTIWCTFKIIPTPADAVVTINGEVRNSVTLLEGSEVSWSVSADKHKEQTGSLTLNSDTLLDIVLEEQNDPLYACYRYMPFASDYNYLYAKCPIGSDTVVYIDPSKKRVQVSSSSNLIVYNGYKWMNLSETSAILADVNYSYNIGDYSRYYEGDLYK